MKQKLVIALALGSAVLGFAQTPAKAPPLASFIRIQGAPGGKETLQTEARRYVPVGKKGPVVWLVGAAHVGEPGYYKSIQGLLNDQSLVLYEAVTRNGVDPAKVKQPGENSIYGLFADSLGLAQQLQSINYQRPTFRRSDLSWEELNALASQKQGTAGTEGLSNLGKALDPNSAQGKVFATFLAGIKNDPGSREAVRLAMAEGLAKTGIVNKVLSPGQGDLILRSRNDHLIADLREVLDDPKAPASLAVFYGAAHMPDLDRQLTQTLGYRQTEVRWFDAIHGDESKVGEKGKPLLGMFRSLFSKLAEKGAP